MKKFLIVVILLGALAFTYAYQNQIVNYILIKSFNNSYKLVSNDYTIGNDFELVQNTKNVVPYNKQDILNIIYTGLNNGADSISIICPTKYENCINEAKDVLYNQELLSNINNYVHPYNTFKELKISSNELGQIDIQISKTYSEDEIKKTNLVFKQIYDSLITDSMTDYEKIETIHDYIVDNTKFDTDKSDNINNPNFVDIYKSSTAFGALINNYAICAGYTDAMSLFLDAFGIKNYRIASENHIWNFVYLDNNWYHLDLTWDDQNTSNSKPLRTYFLITTEKLENIKDGAHNYNKSIFLEAK